jgi:SNF2 family DNA or RNA helicase
MGGLVRGRRIVGRHRRHQVYWSTNALNGENAGHRGARRGLEWSSGSFNEARVRSNVAADRPTYVYDLEMEGHPSFTADGVLVHNSATPVYNNGDEFHSVMDVIKPDALGSRGEFMREWCSGTKGRIAEPKAFGHHVRDSGLMIRRTRADVGREMPKVQKIMHRVDTDLEALEKVSGACRELALFILGRGESPLKRGADAQAGGERMQASEELSNRLRQASGVAKAAYVAEFVRMLVEQGESVVLFGWHRSVYEIWNDKLKDIPRAMFTGSETVAQKDQAKRDFLDRKARILIMSLRAGAGIDGLQKVCRTPVFGELDWSYGVMEQNIGRIDRDGQKDPVVAYFLLADTGIDPIMVDLLGIKRDQLEGLRNPTHSLVEKLQSDPDRVKRLAEAYLAQQQHGGMKWRAT